MNAPEKGHKKQKEPDGLQLSINIALRYMKEIGDNYIKPYLIQEERIRMFKMV